MEPRLPSSRKWTNLPPELAKQMRSVFETGFKTQLAKAKVEIDGRIYPNELLLSVGFSRAQQLKQPNFDVSITYDPKRDNVMTLLNLMFDAAGALFDQYFQAADDADFPRIWEEIDFEGRKIYVQYHTQNSELEAQADRLLGSDDDSLVRDEVSEDLESIKGRLGLTDDDEESEED